MTDQLSLSLLPTLRAFRSALAQSFLSALAESVVSASTGEVEGLQGIGKARRVGTATPGLAGAAGGGRGGVRAEWSPMGRIV